MVAFWSERPRRVSAASMSNDSSWSSCLLVVMTSTLQVSVYAPRRGAASNQWDEVGGTKPRKYQVADRKIADLTYLTKSLFPKKAKDQPPSVPEVLQMRATGTSTPGQPMAADIFQHSRGQRLFQYRTCSGTMGAC